MHSDRKALQSIKVFVLLNRLSAWLRGLRLVLWAWGKIFSIGPSLDALRRLHQQPGQ
jgi:hypothetical protein